MSRTTEFIDHTRVSRSGCGTDTIGFNTKVGGVVAYLPDGSIVEFTYDDAIKFSRWVEALERQIGSRSRTLNKRLTPERTAELKDQIRKRLVQSNHASEADYLRTRMLILGDGWYSADYGESWGRWKDDRQAANDPDPEPAVESEAA